MKKDEPKFTKDDINRLLLLYKRRSEQMEKYGWKKGQYPISLFLAYIEDMIDNMD